MHRPAEILRRYDERDPELSDHQKAAKQIAWLIQQPEQRLKMLTETFDSRVELMMPHVAERYLALAER